MHLKGNRRRRGAIIPMAALLSVLIFGMVAFAVDIGWIAVAQSELQNAADAAAFAGANPLMNGYVQYNLATTNAAKNTILTGTLASAQAKAIEYASYNAAGGASSLVLKSGDIEFGFIDANNNYTPQPTFTGFPNTIKVVMRRDGQANKSLPLFFGPVLGNNTTNLNATASATIFTGTIDSFAQSNINSGMLPVTYDVNHWNSFLKTGQSPDGSTMTDANGLPEIQVYPSLKFPGNFGQLSLNDSHVGASTEKAWVDNGIASSDIKALTDNKLIPLSSHNPNNWDWQGDTGFKASLVSDINGHTGQTYILPLFAPANASQANYAAGQGQGSNYFYNIVQFVGIQIMPSGDNNGQVIVQPAAVLDPNAIFNQSTVVPAGNAGQLVTTFTAPKLTR
jgi:Flp pilus assembly protein TadG